MARRTMVRFAMSFDLLIKGGHVLDPGQGLDGRFDIAITAGRIAAIEPDISLSAFAEARANGVIMFDSALGR